MSGPILGHEVSGYESMATVFVERGQWPGWLTGGEFGIEGSVWMTHDRSSTAIAVVWQYRIRRAQRRLPSRQIRSIDE